MNRNHKGKIRIATLILFYTVFNFAVHSQLKLDEESLSKLSQYDIDAAADHLEFIGDNLIGRGNVVVKYKDLTLKCDKTIINLNSKDIELEGNVVFVRRTETTEEIEKWLFEEYQKDPSKRVIVQGYVNKPSGRRVLLVNVVTETAIWEGERVAGNLTTGYFDLGPFEGKYQNFFFNAENAERQPDGVIKLNNATFSTCEYLLEDNDHWSVTASRVKFFPVGVAKDADPSSKYVRDEGRYDIWAYNCTVRIGSVPIFWSPVLYKASDESGFGWQIVGGKDRDWGYYVKTKKRVRVYSDPDVYASLLADYYSKRGPGAGLLMEMRTERSYTEGFLYGIYDKDKDKTPHDRFNIHKERYDAYLKSRWHITPRFDFRGQIEKISDINFLYDFFEDRYNNDPQPATYANMDYQFDRFIISGTVRPRVNDFFSEVERLPEFRLDIPRQELFSNVYYQGETSIAYLKMRWRDYDQRRTAGNLIDPEDYRTGRFDTVNMLYYPLNFDWLNVIPRSGIRLSYYNKSSKRKISPAELQTMIGVDNSGRGQIGGDLVNYDRDGSDQWRFIYEGGIELNTKLSRSWTDIKNAFWDIDGIRHVIVPYINYNFIPKPTVSRDKLYYFDDIDRISRQNFVRLGIQNRIQTRRGDWDEQAIFTWLSMENYWDFHFERERKIDGKKFPNMGDFGTKVEFTPIPDFSFKHDLLIDSSDFQINKYSTSLEYEITKDWKLKTSYNYQRNYEQRSVYSMGSSVTDITSGSSFIRRYGKNHYVSFGLDFPIRESTRGEFEIDYDLKESLIRDSRIRLIQNLHCWEMAVEYGLSQSKRYKAEGKREREYNHKFMIMFYLTAAPSVKIQAKQSRKTGGEGNSDGD